MNEYIRRAEHALRTGQPNLAVLYMRRGLAETPEGRWWLRKQEIKAWLHAAFRLDETQADYALAGGPKR